MTDERNTEFFTPQNDENEDIVVQIKKIALVTGGMNGLLGPIWTEVLRRNGFYVASMDLPYGDITNESKVREVEDYLEESDNMPSILVNNAAIDNPPGSDASFFGNFDKIMDVNINGAARMAKAVIPSMIKNGGGVIINVGSIQGRIGADWRNYPEGFEKPSGYNCSKAAMEQLTRSIAVQYGRYNIRSVCIAFGPYNGGKLSETFLDKFLNNVPLGRTISKESLQKTLMYAIECPELTGQTILVDGGYTAW
jgi:NAD(P)-dependent dehydrogenase (short-subunit alcohol dehydrogenase family)